MSTIYEKNWSYLLRENRLLKNEIAEMQKTVHILQIRVKELNEQIYLKENK